MNKRPTPLLYKPHEHIFLMNDLYNFLGSWQLFPEKGTYESGERPRSGTYKIEKTDIENELIIELNWVSLQNQAFHSTYKVMANGDVQNFKDDRSADKAKIIVHSKYEVEIVLWKDEHIALSIMHELLPNGFLKITQSGKNAQQNTFQNTEIYHRQLSVLPYAASVGGALIQPNQNGMIKHSALNAMEEQTNMQLDQIRKQVDLLAQQAQEIINRKELSMKIYDATLGFKPIIGTAYFLYEKKNGSFTLSMIGPKEWGRSFPFEKFVAHVRLLADHTWKELPLP